MPKRHLSDLHEQAFQLHLQGLSFEQIAPRIKVAKSSVQRWSLGNERTGERPWAEREAEIHGKVRALADDRAIAQADKMLRDYTELRDKVFTELKEVKFKSKEGAIGAFRSLTEQIIKLAPHSREISDKGLQAIFGIFDADPDLGPILRRAVVSERIMKKIELVLRSDA